MSAVPLDSATPGEVYDNALRWLIPSHSDPHASHVVELCAFPGYSVCDCTDFVCRFGPLLKAGVKPEDALAKGLVKKRKYHFDESDSLKCKHIIIAERQLALATIRSFSYARTQNLHRSRPA